MTSALEHAPDSLGLYLHIPWCVRKCPYCDFNSHQKRDALPESAYLAALVADLEADLQRWQSESLDQRPVHTLFIGGGTPSLMSAIFYKQLFAALGQRLDLSQLDEITLEANPGTLEQGRFDAYREAGINRLSLGVQSFDPEQLTTLGRIHGPDQAHQAIEAAHKAGFERVNVDLMHGLPGQTPDQAVADLDAALAHGIRHLSWYQLTLEPNTEFYSRPPLLPTDDTLWDIQAAGQARLEAAGLSAYEVSAWSTPGEACRHNLNYWRFGDYLALGAGAHGKLSLTHNGDRQRYWKTRQPEAYLNRIGSRTAGQQVIAPADLPLEFLMNGLRLSEGVATDRFTDCTGLPLSVLEPALSELRDQGLMVADPERLAPTELGRRHLNTLLERFMADPED